MADKKNSELNKKLEEAKKIYQNLIASEVEKEKKRFEELHKNFIEPLSFVEQQRKKEIELLSQSINSVQNSMQDQFMKDKYIDKYSDIAQSLSDTKEFLEASSALTSLEKEINNDIYKYKMDDINNRKKLFHDFEYAKPIEIRNYASEMLEEFKIQNEKLNIVIEKLEKQNVSLDRQIEQDKVSSEKQIYKLQEQINKSDVSFAQQLKDSRKQMRWTIAIAVVSIVVAIGSTIWSLNKSEDIYYKEDNSSDLQHKELKEILENNSNKNLILEDKQLNVLNQILQSLNEKKIIKDKNITK